MALNEQEMQEVKGRIDRLFGEGMEAGKSADEIVHSILNNSYIRNNIPYLDHIKNAKFMPQIEGAIDDQLKEILIAERKARKQYDTHIVDTHWKQYVKEFLQSLPCALANFGKLIMLERPHPVKAYNIKKDESRNNYKRREIESLAELVDDNRETASGFKNKLDVCEDNLKIIHYIADSAVKKGLVKDPGAYGESKNSHSPEDMENLRKMFPRLGANSVLMPGTEEKPFKKEIPYLRSNADRDHLITPVTERQRELSGLIDRFYTQAVDAYDAFNKIKDALENAGRLTDGNLKMRRYRPSKILSVGAGDYVPKPE